MPKSKTGNQGRVLPTRGEILDAIRMLSKGERHLSMKVFSRESGISITQIYKHFDSWLDAREEAGQPRRGKGVKTWSDDQLFEEYLRITRQLHRFPSTIEFARLSPMSYGTFATRFGPVPEVRKRFRKWLRKRERELREAAERAGNAAEESQRNPTRLADDRTGHADLDPVRWLMRAWFGLRVGFELQSSDFRGRKPTDCDVLVVLEHNWPACPVRVLELRKVMPEVDAVGLRPMPAVTETSSGR